MKQHPALHPCHNACQHLLQYLDPALPTDRILGVLRMQQINVEGTDTYAWEMALWRVGT